MRIHLVYYQKRSLQLHTPKTSNMGRIRRYVHIWRTSRIEERYSNDKPMTIVYKRVLQIQLAVVLLLLLFESMQHSQKNAIFTWNFEPISPASLWHLNYNMKTILSFSFSVSY